VQRGARVEAHAEQRAELAGRDDERGRGGEAAEHRARQEVDDEAEAQRAHAELDRADHGGRAAAVTHVGLGAGEGDAAEGGGDQQRVHRDRADGELGRAAEDA
jgi:hypothetical protein